MTNLTAPAIDVQPPRHGTTLLVGAHAPMVGHIPHKTSWIHHTFNLHALGLVTSGEGEYRVGNGSVTRLRAGCLFPVYPGPTFHYGPDPGTAWEEYHIGLFGRDATPWLKKGMLLRHGIVRRVGHLETIVSLFQDVIATMRRGGPGDPDRSLVGAQRLLVELHYCQEHLLPKSTSPDRVQSVLDYCRTHLNENIDFHELARTHGVSYSRLREQLRLATGFPPAQYLTRLRCQYASSLLLDPKLSVKEIADRAGFTDAFAFSRAFKRHMGVSPRDWRSRSAALAPAG